ncbi:hypothetical protein AMS68_005342 [Peltaster fructicola]|uniref:Bactericidal permeability-increasing protein n=1 Tax=Peltaster fructicola TaxID=286661 RepID=A0A6H0XYT2_9PEZI|nr:hypothetical protein AMS68_005342 [Peltaster fructicola]
MSSCLGFRKKPSASDREPLLPQYETDTDLQARLMGKLHTYQQFRALSKQYMPTTEQAIINLRTILASDVLNPENVDLSDSGRLLTKNVKVWLQQFMDLLQHKNGEDELQRSIWALAHSRISVDVDDLAKRASRTKVKADSAAAFSSLQTVGSLLLTNQDFRIFLHDLQIIGREVFRDSSKALSKVAEDAAKQLEPSKEEEQALKKPGADGDVALPSSDDLKQDVAEVGKSVAEAGKEVATTAIDSAGDKLEGAEGETLIKRLQSAVVNLRKKDDYSDSVSVLAKLLQRYAKVYSRAAGEILDVAQEDIHENKALDAATENIWTLVKNFGDRDEWEKLAGKFDKVMQHSRSDPDFEKLMGDAANSLQKLLTDPEFLNNAQQKFKELREESKKVGKESSLRQDVDEFFGQLELVYYSVIEDADLSRLHNTSLRILNILSPTNLAVNKDLLQDSLSVFVPELINAVQNIPIPRLEVSTPEIDLLLENLIIEPGKTVNRSSFLPYSFKVETYNDLELFKGRHRTGTRSKHTVTLKLNGLSTRADEIGFVMRLHAGLLRLNDEGIVSFAVDERGIDIHLDVEIAKEKLEEVLTLKAVRVHIHKLNFELRKSKFSILAWILKPLIRPILRKTLEHELANAISDFFHAANRELLFARERLRATRIADPHDLLKFFQAVAARLQPEDDPDVDVKVGVRANQSRVFKGVYAPGSIVKLWEEEALRAGERVEEFDAGGWKNEIFDVHARHLT